MANLLIKTSSFIRESQVIDLNSIWISIIKKSLKKISVFPLFQELCSFIIILYIYYIQCLRSFRALFTLFILYFVKQHIRFEHINKITIISKSSLELDICCVSSYSSKDAFGRPNIKKRLKRWELGEKIDFCQHLV